MRDAIADLPAKEMKDARESGAYWRTQEMFLIQEVMRLVGKGLEMDGVLREMLHLLSELLGLNRGRIVLQAPDGEGHRIAYAYGLTREEMARGRYAPGEGITGGSFRTVISSSCRTSTRSRCSWRGRWTGRACRRASCLSSCFPFSVQSRTVGALACHRIRHRDRALADDVTMLRIMSTLIGQLLTLHARMDAKTKALQEQNERLARELRAGRTRYGIIGTSPALLRALEQVEQVSAATASVLLLAKVGRARSCSPAPFIWRARAATSPSSA